MGTMKVSLPNALREFVEEQGASAGYRTPCEYVRELIRREQERQQLRRQLPDGALSALTGTADAVYFLKLRKRTNVRVLAKRHA